MVGVPQPLIRAPKCCDGGKVNTSKCSCVGGGGYCPPSTSPSALPPKEPREVPDGHSLDCALGAAEPEELRRDQTGDAGSGERRTVKVLP